MPVMRMVDAIRDTLAAEMAPGRPGCCCWDRTWGETAACSRATAGLRERFGADRVVDMPLAEGVIAGAAVGLPAAASYPLPSCSSSASAARPSTSSKARWRGCAFARRAGSRCRS